MPAAPDTEVKEIRVLVTGFGLWSDHSSNPSFEIVKLLPDSIEVPSTSSTRKVQITLIRHSTAIPVSWHTAATLVPKLLETTQPDLVLHIGLAANRTWFGPELGSNKPRTTKGDVNGEIWSEAESDAKWPTLPDRLETSLAYDQIIDIWFDKCQAQGIEVDDLSARGLQGVTAPKSLNGCAGPNGFGKLPSPTTTLHTVRRSDSVGAFLCGFTYFTSLAWFYSKYHDPDPATEAASAPTSGPVPKGGPVLFLHVPQLDDPASLSRGTHITTALLQSMVETLQL